MTFLCFRKMEVDELAGKPDHESGMAKRSIEARIARSHKMKRVVILRGPSIDSTDEYVLTECLRILFPDSEIQVLARQAGNASHDGVDQGH